MLKYLVDEGHSVDEQLCVWSILRRQDIC